MIATITPQQLLEKRRRGESIELIDVRTPAEFQEVHVEFARNVPLDRLDPRAILAERSGNGHSSPLYVICRSGSRSKQACEKLSAAGLGDVFSVDGGTSACEAAGVPVRRGRKTMSLERQVRIAAGALVAIGAAVAAFGPDPLWQRIGAGLAGFVGCGLVFAGITDTCGMAMLIARMPWNQATCGDATSCSRGVLAAIVLAATASAAIAGHTKDSLETVRQKVDAGEAVLVDVREDDEWRRGHLDGARLVPLSALEAGIPPEQLAKILPKDKVIYCHCAAGGRCLEAALILGPLGYDVRPLKSGFGDLVKSGFPAAVTPLR